MGYCLSILNGREGSQGQRRIHPVRQSREASGNSRHWRDFRSHVWWFLKGSATCFLLEKCGRKKLGVNDELCAFPMTIEPSKSSLQILWPLLENIHLETKRSNEGKPESERSETNERRLRSPLYFAD
jgi:hypothetical protein